VSVANAFRSCEFCGASLVHRRRHAKFCGAACRADAWRAGRRVAEALAAARKRSYSARCARCGGSAALKDDDGAVRCLLCGHGVKS
jgi:hypothetical protein